LWLGAALFSRMFCSAEAKRVAALQFKPS